MIPVAAPANDNYVGQVLAVQNTADVKVLEKTRLL